MKICAVIACYNHNKSLNCVAETVSRNFFTIVVDDGSQTPVSFKNPNSLVIRNKKNLGKAQSLKIAFKKACALGFTHAITLDADLQHPPEFAQNFAKAAAENKNCIIVGVRDFEHPTMPIPPKRLFMNKFSNFWFYKETKVKLGDTQCGYRCYPLSEIEKLKLNFSGFVFETEILVKAAWGGIGLTELKIPAVYTEESIKNSHYKPFLDTLKFSLMNTRLYFESLLLPKCILKKLALK